MDITVRQIWRVIFVIIIIATQSYALDCKNIDRKKCACFNAENTDIQCPATDSQINMSVTKKNYITLQCQIESSPYIDLDIIPDVDIPEARLFTIEYCYLNTSFTNILRKFNIQELKTLIFESMAQKDMDMNITLTKESFESLESLESLTFSYSTIYFARDFLANTPNLLSLVLSKNDINELQRYFKYVPKLKMLELSGNQINTLPDGIFEDLSNLTRLFLFSNNITSLSRNAFAGLNNLRLLELSNNHIEELPEDTFADLHKLVNISLRGNQIKKAYSNIFANNPLLENIRIGNNADMIVSDNLFANLTVLKTIELYLNNLKIIPENTFKNCVKLVEITLKRNLLTSLPQNIFKDLKKLRTLDLSDNRLNSLPDEVFSSLESLETLNLSNNQLSVINQYLFKYLDHLKRLDLHRNKLYDIDLRAFSGQNALTHLDLSFNKWNNSYDLPSIFIDPTPLGHLVKLEELILSHNELNQIPGLISLLELKKLDLSYNQIDYLPMLAFARAIGFTYEVDLSNNKIEQINFSFAEAISRDNTDQEPQYDAIHYNGGSTVLKLFQNPIVCDCSNYDLVRYNNDEMKELKTLVNINQDGLMCANDNTIKVADLRPNDVDCPVPLGCPDLCKCSYKPYNAAIIVDCSFNNLTSYPAFGFQIALCTYNQTYLILRGNKLTKGPSIEEINYSNITYLDLSNNSITDVDWIPPQIKELNLNDNSINNLDSHFIGRLKNATALERLHLKGNPWECSCKSLDLQKYLMQFYHKVNSSDVYCQNYHVQLVKYTDICKVSPYLSVLSPIVLAVFLCFAVALALYYRYQREIKVYLFAKNMCLWFITEQEVDKDKTYDVFISYSHQDEKFVVDHLLAELEHGEKPFKVCIHMRDWIPGEFIAEQVVNSVKDSRRTLVVLSDNFVDSVWGKLEFRTAHTEAISEGRARVIVVIYGDLDESKLDEELKSYLKTNTYVKWGDRYFWNKLKYALPHSRNNFYERNKKHANVMLKIDDKFDLIKNPPSPSNTSTPPITLDPSLLEGKDLRIDMSKRIEGEHPLLVKQV